MKSSQLPSLSNLELRAHTAERLLKISMEYRERCEASSDRRERELLTEVADKFLWESKRLYR